MSSRRPEIPSPIVAIVGWLVPGAGYCLIGQWSRGLTIGITIITLFVLGILFAGVRVIEVPGYDEIGMPVRVDPQGRRYPRTHPDYEQGGWAITSGGLVGEIANKPWYIPQVLAGPITLISSSYSVRLAQQGVTRVHARLMDIGTLYTAIAGMLNLLAMIDSAHRARHDAPTRG
jgi:hypothetical protein